MQPKLFDSHTHSLHSVDARDSVDALCRAALQAGLEGIAITDHCDMGHLRLPDWRERLERSLCDAQDAAGVFSGRLQVRVGIELGQALHEPELSREVLRLPFDVVLASVHNLRDTDDFFYLSGGGIDQRRRLLDRYFTELLQVAEQADFDVLAHLTYPYRYFGYGDDTPPITEFEQPLRAIFTALSRRNKALELNLSPLRHPGALQPTLPGLWELGLFRDCGGELVTLGSDAHRSEQVGRCLVQGAALLHKAGFSRQVFFRGRHPEFFALC
jgi:histidinol-phosphatase (PHP family)